MNIQERVTKFNKAVNALALELPELVFNHFHSLWCDLHDEMLLGNHHSLAPQSNAGVSEEEKHEPYLLSEKSLAKDWNSEADSKRWDKPKANELLEALNKIANWELPSTGLFWDKEQTEPMSYEAAYGSNGARDFMRNIAKEAIAKHGGAI